MAGSRLERIGTIFSRVTGLLQSKALAFEDRPIWYDVYKAFPPVVQPRYDRSPPEEPLTNIFYPEDVIRAKFHRKMGRSVPSIDLLSDNKTITATEKLIQLCVKFQKEKQMNIDDAFQSALETLKADGTLMRPYSSRRSRTDAKDGSTKNTEHSLVDSFKEFSATDNRKNQMESSQVDIKNIFKDKDT